MQKKPRICMRGFFGVEAVSEIYDIDTVTVLISV